MEGTRGKKKAVILFVDIHSDRDGSFAPLSFFSSFSCAV